ncbi:Transcriptional activator protein ExaE [Halioglobus japonicus]|nr:Transcriptional activator protein ExaE [Halioglobus japonicus]
MSSRVLIVDDHPIIRDALVTSLISLGVFEDVETAASFQELLEKLERDGEYQLLVLDLSLTDVSGADGMLYIREHYPALPVVIFSGNDSVDIVAQCFENGVHGFVSKNSSMQVFVSAIRIVLAGSTYIPPSAASLMGFESNPVIEAELLPAQEQIRFTPKQQEVFEQLIQGVPNKVIARRLNMAEGTVKTHLHGIYQLLRVGNRAQAILRSQQLQIIK